MIYQQFLHTGKPTSEKLFDMLKAVPVPIISNLSFPGWPDGGMPDFSWYEAAAKTKTPSGMLVIDMESWPTSTRKERRDASRKFCIVYKTMKHFIPETMIGFYSYTPNRDLFNAITPPSSRTFLDWQSRNDDFSEHISCVDVLFPSIYYFYNRALNGPNANVNASLYFRRNLTEAIRLRNTYGSMSRPIIPYIWWEKHPGGPLLDSDVWESMVQTSLDLTGNCLAWGGFQRTWDDSAPWLETLKTATSVRS